MATYEPIPWPSVPRFVTTRFFSIGSSSFKVYMIPIQNMEHLKQRICTACEEICRDSIIETTIETIETTGNLLHRVELCLQENGL